MNKLWLRSFMSLLCVCQLFVAAHICRAEEEKETPAEKLLPKETLFFFSISDMSDLSAKWDKTSFGQLFHDPKLKPFLDDVSKKKAELSKQCEDEIGVSIDDLLSIPQGELTFAAWEKPARTISLVLMVEYGDSKETVEKLLKKMDDELEKDGAEHSTEEIHEIKVHVYKPKDSDPDSPFKSLVYFTDEDVLVMSNEIDAIKEVLERWNGESDDTLADNPQYKHIQTQCKLEKEPQIKFFLNPSGIIQTTISMIQSSVPQVGMAAGFLPLLGFDGMKGYGGAIGFDEGDYEAIANFYFYAENPRGVLGVFNFPAVDLTPPKWVPASVASYSVLNWDVIGAYKSIETLVDSFQGRGSTARFLDQLADNEPNIHVKKDVLDLLDGKIHLLQSESKEADGDAPPIPAMFFALGLKDAAAMKKTVTAAIKAAGQEVESREFNGETIYHFSPPGGEQTFSFAIAQGYLFMTNDTPTLEGTIRGRSGQGAPLSDSPDYKRSAKLFPAKTSMQTYQKSDVQMKMYYNLLKKMDSDAIEGIDVSKLPPFEAISKYLLPNAGYIVPDKKGFKTVSFTLKRND